MYGGGLLFGKKTLNVLPMSGDALTPILVSNLIVAGSFYVSLGISTYFLFSSKKNFKAAFLSPALVSVVMVLAMCLPQVLLVGRLVR